MIKAQKSMYLVDISVLNELQRFSAKRSWLTKNLRDQNTYQVAMEIDAIGRTRSTKLELPNGQPCVGFTRRQAL
ncbi:MAG: hypothetical protein U5K51_17085 [Flavobacteriaceae bacterium]|nr:hypothetical protein [Flavobacteriaceae bacterium]